jgi:hypothetical protein
LTQDNEIIRQIEDVLQGRQPIQASIIRIWMSCPSLEVKGAVAILLRKCSNRITPPMSTDEICTSFETYYRECLIQNPKDGDWVSNRYVTGHELVNWFRTLWKDPAVPRVYLLRLKNMLRELYLSDESLRNVIVDSVLEHLFEMREVADFFGDWKSDPQLNEAFERARDWTRKDPSKLVS